jgi:hypothetical protein
MCFTILLLVFSCGRKVDLTSVTAKTRSHPRFKLCRRSLKAYQAILCFYTRWETIEISQSRKEQTAFYVVRPRIRQIEGRVSEGKMAMNVSVEW